MIRIVPITIAKIEEIIIDVYRENPRWCVRIPEAYPPNPMKKV
jgi:hypothetical protein